jgi:general secretion pathway protein M
MRALFDPAQLPTGRNGRLLALGLLAVAIGLVWLAVVAPLLGWFSARQDALDNRIRYADRMESIAASLPQARAEAAVARRQAPPPNMILAGNSDPIAAAALESLIDGMSRQAGATLISTESLQPVQVGGYRRIGLHATARASWDKLIRLLAAIERASPRMTVSNLQVQAGPLGGPEQLLDMSLTVNAFRAGTEAASADQATDPDTAP